MKNKEPKNDLRAEQIVLSILINYPNSFIEAEEIINNPDVFYNATNSIIFSIMLEVSKIGAPTTLPKLIPTLKLKGLPNEKELLADILTIKRIEAEETELRSLCLYLRELYILRQSWDIGVKITQANNLQDITKHQESLDKCVLSASNSKDIVSIGQALESVIEGIKNPVEGITGVETGLKKLNYSTWGWQGSDVIVLAGATGMGKTTCAIHHAKAAAMSGIPVAFATFEMSGEHMSRRFLSSWSGVPYGKILRSKLLTEPDKKAIQKANIEMTKVPIYFYDAKNGTDINEFSVKMKIWQRKYGIGLIIVDYIQLLRDNEIKSTDEYAQVTAVSRKMKRLQGQLGIPIIEVAQISRSVANREDKRPTKHDLKDSGQLENDASVIIGLYRPDYYNKELADKGLLKDKNGQDLLFVPTNQIEYIRLKARDGETGINIFGCDMETYRLYDL